MNYTRNYFFTYEGVFYKAVIDQYDAERGDITPVLTKCVNGLWINFGNNAYHARECDTPTCRYTVKFDEHTYVADVMQCENTDHPRVVMRGDEPYDVRFGDNIYPLSRRLDPVQEPPLGDLDKTQTNAYATEQEFLERYQGMMDNRANQQYMIDPKVLKETEKMLDENMDYFGKVVDFDLDLRDLQEKIQGEDLGI